LRDITKAFLESCVEVFDFPDPVVEIGSLQVPGQEGYGDIRPYFKGKKFEGCDMRPGPGVDRIENLEKLTFADASLGSIVMLDVIEHVRDLQSCFKEVRRVLREDGVLIMSSHMDFPIHAYPYDYWRFTPKAFEELLSGFGSVLVGIQGAPEFPHTVMAVAIPAKGKLGPEAAARLKAALASRVDKPAFYKGRLAMAFKRLVMPFLWKGYIYQRELFGSKVDFFGPDSN
jgi:SAM-dependent methyltransferase